MADQFANLPFNQVRRQDREVTEAAWIKDFLHRAPYGVLAMVSAEQPFTNANLFVYAEGKHVIYLHTSDEGRTYHTVSAEARVCFSVSAMGRLLPAENARGLSVEYAGVTIFGRDDIVIDDEERVHGLQLLIDKYFPHLAPGRDYQTIDYEQMQGTAIHRITVESWSAKLKQAPPDFPGAFFFEEQVPPFFSRSPAE